MEISSSDGVSEAWIFVKKKKKSLQRDIVARIQCTKVWTMLQAIL